MGSGISILTNEELEELKQQTPLDERDISRLLKRYSFYDKTERGTEGIPYQTLMEFPEMRGNPLLPSFVLQFMDSNTQRLMPQQYLLLFGVLSSKASVKDKGELLFQSYDVTGSGVLKLEELRNLYEDLFNGSLSEEQVHTLATEALDYPDLETPGEITFNEFKKMVPGSEIMQRLIVDLQVSS